MKAWALLLLAAANANAEIRVKAPVVPRVTVNVPLSAPLVPALGGMQSLTPGAALHLTPSLETLPAPSLAPALAALPSAPLAAASLSVAPPAPRAAAAVPAEGEQAPDAAQTVLGQLRIAGAVETEADGRVTAASMAKLDSLFEAWSRGRQADELRLGPAAPGALLRALPPSEKAASTLHPFKEYRRMHRRRHAREVARWGAAAAGVASGGALIGAAASLLERVQRWSARNSPDDVMRASLANAQELPQSAPETVLLREGLQELYRRAGKEPRFRVSVHAFAGPSAFAAAGMDADGVPHYYFSAAYAHAPDMVTAAAFAAVAAHEFTHAAHAHHGHMDGAAVGNWRSMLFPAMLAGWLLAVKAAILYSPLAALPYADSLLFFVIGPSLPWTAALLALFLGFTLAQGLFEAAVRRSMEYQADHFAALYTRPDWMVTALRYLRDHFGDQDLGAFAQHPTLHRRIMRLRATFESGKKP